MLTLQESDRVRICVSWAKVMSSPETAAELFYARLFEQYPSTRALFSDDIAAQGKKLIETLNTVVDNLETDLTAPIAQLGLRHQGYNVAAEDYDRVGEALLWMLDAMVGTDFDTATQQAWARAYTQISAMMIKSYG